MTEVSSLVRCMICHQLAMTAAKRGRVRPLFHRLAAEGSAMPSMFSRSRASEKRKSASTRCWRKFSAASGRPTRCVSAVPIVRVNECEPDHVAGDR